MAIEVKDECYVGRKECGCFVAAIVDAPEHRKDTAREVAKWIRQGLAIERMSVEDVRQKLMRCPHTDAQGTLL